MDCPVNRTYRNNVQSDHDGMNLKNIKLEALTFDGQLDPQVFLDWTLAWIITLIGMICPTRDESDVLR